MSPDKVFSTLWYLQTQVTMDASRKHCSLHWTWYKLNGELRSEQIIAFILGNGKAKKKVMQCYDINYSDC